MSASATGNKPRLALVTGGAGFIGSHLTDALIAQGLRVRVLDNFVAGPRENVNPAAEIVVGDVRVPDSIRPAFAGVDCVFHLAALPRVIFSIEHPVETHLTNVVGTLNALIAARDAGVNVDGGVYERPVRVPYQDAEVSRPQLLPLRQGSHCCSPA